MQPFLIPTESGSRRDALRFCFGDQFFMCVLRVELGEEDVALVEGFDVGDEVLGIAIDETIGGSQMKEETVSDEFCGSVIEVGAL